jgi:hypothetical protein
LVATPGVLVAIPFPEIVHFVARHARCDWGELCPEDVQENERSLQRGHRLLSAYTSSTGVRLWVTTECDRSSTTVLLPDEY